MYRYFLFLLFSFISSIIVSQNYSVKGIVIDKKDKRALDFCLITISDYENCSLTDAEGNFTLHNINKGNYIIQASVLGYETLFIDIEVNSDIDSVLIELQQRSLKLDEVMVTAKLNNRHISSSYSIDRTTLDHTQTLNISDITSLLPGGKFRGDLNLTSSQSLTVRSRNSEKGNAAFGTAIEIDGVRINNNAAASETSGADTRNISIINIESVEVISGIPSVEYGDLTEGLVRINTQKGKTPFIAEIASRPNTKQIALSKGFSIGKDMGIINISAERTKSISDISSPFTSYERNGISFNYANRINKNDKLISFNWGINGNFGGYNSKADPDEFKETYQKQRDNNFRTNLSLNYFLNLKWLSKIEFTASVNYQDKRTETNTNKSSSSTISAIHSITEGYFIGSKYDENPNSDIILLEPGYWYQLSYYDNRPIYYNAKIKADHVKKIGKFIYHKFYLGAELSSSGNFGKGTYYDDMRYAPTWRENRLNDLPFMHNYSLFASENIDFKFNNGSSLEISAGLRFDISSINKSEYKNISNSSPRFNSKYTVIKNRDSFFSDLDIYAGWGRAVKLPSFEVLYPTTNYSDKLSFVSGSDALGNAFYAYHTIPSKAIYNPDLKWQKSDKIEIGTNFNLGGTKISVSVFKNVTKDPYISSTVYTPYSYKLTSQKHLENCVIPSDRRLYSIDRVSGVVTVSDINNIIDSETLDYDLRNTFLTNKTFCNGSSVVREGLEYIVDFPRIEVLRTSLRVDGNMYRYKGVENTILASMPNSTITMNDGSSYQYVGYYDGGALSSNGNISHSINTNFTLTTHIPKVRLIVSLRLEATFLSKNQYLSESQNKIRGIIIETPSDYTGITGNIYNGENYVALYPEYYTTWNNPENKIDFAEAFLWAKDNDPILYKDLSKLVVRSNTNYFFRPDKISSYYSSNLSVTKEIGNFATLTFYATNFLNNLSKIESKRNNTESSLYNSSYIPKFYYGISLRIKI